MEKLLEAYSLHQPQEVLRITIGYGDITEEIIVFRGFTSSLSCPTAFDPDQPVFHADAEILTIDRLQAPYNPQKPIYIAQNLSWQEFQALL